MLEWNGNESQKEEKKIYKGDRENLDWFEYFSDQLHIGDSLVSQARDYHEEKLKRNFNQDELLLVAMALYIQCRQEGRPRSRKQFAKEISNLIMNKRKSDTFKELTTIYLKIRKKTDINMRTIRPYEFLDFLSKELDLTEQQVNDTKEVCEQMISDPSFSGRDPMCICGAGLMKATEGISLEELSEATATSSTTIDNIKEIIDNETDI